MSRKSIYLGTSDEFFHVYNRGANREPLFFSHRNYLYFLRRIREALPLFSVSLHSFCLMPNHFHFLLNQGHPYAVAGFMKRLCDGYAKAVNRELGRKGHLFEERYRMEHVGDNEGLVAVSAYIHRNPVAARLVDSPLEWPYSSCGVLCGMSTDGMVVADPVWRAAGGKEPYIDLLLHGTMNPARQIVQPIDDR